MINEVQALLARSWSGSAGNAAHSKPSPARAGSRSAESPNLELANSRTAN